VRYKLESLNKQDKKRREYHVAFRPQLIINGCNKGDEISIPNCDGPYTLNKCGPSVRNCTAFDPIANRSPSKSFLYFVRRLRPFYPQLQPQQRSMPMLPLPTAGAVAASPVTAAGVAAPLRPRPLRLIATPAITASSSPSTSTSAISSASPAGHSRKHLSGREGSPSKPTKPRVFFLDVNPLCFRGSQRSLGAFARWLALFFAHVSLRDPVVAVSTRALFCFSSTALHRRNHR
jgi:hypothetical protein